MKACHATPAPIEDTQESICGYSFDEFFEAVRAFHSYAAPGVLIGGVMVDVARRALPPDILFDAVAETAWCLPDAVQMLTPCTVGNGWLKIRNLGIYALALYDKHSGQGFRVALDPARFDPCPHVAAWLLKTKPKREQDSDALREEIRLFGRRLCSVTPVQVKSTLLTRRSKDTIAICPLCGNAYPRFHGRICRACGGESPYADGWAGQAPIQHPGPNLRLVTTEEAVGHTIVHDMTRIEPGKSKGALFRRGQTIDVGDVCALQRMGRRHVYIEDAPDADPNWVHEDEAAKAFAEAMAGEGVSVAGPAREGKVGLLAAENGLFYADEKRLLAFNCVPEVMVACRRNYSLVTRGRNIAGTRAIPLFLAAGNFAKAMDILAEGPLFTVKPMPERRVGLLITGNEVYEGLIEERFEPIITAKVEALGSQIHGRHIVPDNAAAIENAARELLSIGCELIITTAGMSVDPDDVSRHGLIAAGLDNLLYGAPVLPGAMLLLGTLGTARVVGVPACALFFKTTSFDIVLPRLLADVPITRYDLAELASGGLCMECSTCQYPKCPFGR